MSKIFLVLSMPYFIQAMIIDDMGQVTRPVIRLMELTGVQPTNDLDEAVERTQAKWLRPQGLERWQDNERFSFISEDLRPIFQRLGMCEEISSSQKRYAYAVLLGSHLLSAVDRAEFLEKSLKAGITVGRLIILTGQRDLTEEEKAYLLKLQGTGAENSETDLMKSLVEKSQIPHQLKSEALVVDAPKIKTPQGFRRPTTDSTLKAWLQYAPLPSSCLIISSNPFIGYQDSVVRTSLPQAFKLETVGPVDSRPYHAELYLDTVARWLYQERLRQRQTIRQSRL